MTRSRRSFLADAGVLTLVGCFAPRLLGTDAPAEGRRRYALLVNLALCNQKPGCQECRIACHEAHNVPSIPDPAREVKWIWKEGFERIFPTEVNPLLPEAVRDFSGPVLCNHCDDPPCVRVCPTGATFVRPDGIVAMDQHRCIGCRYCMAACPYGARSFNFQDPRPFLEATEADYPTRTRGVVEKCDFCSERLGTGRQPACVEACPTQALVFGEVAELAKSISSQRVIRRRPELGTSPHVFYAL